MVTKEARRITQANWRAKTDRQRIEVYLPKGVVSQLDAAVAARIAPSRAEMLTLLVGHCLTADGNLSTGKDSAEALAQAIADLRWAYHGATDRRVTKAAVAMRITRALAALVPLVSTGSFGRMASEPQADLPALARQHPEAIVDGETRGHDKR